MRRLCPRIAGAAVTVTVLMTASGAVPAQAMRSDVVASSEPVSSELVSSELVSSELVSSESVRIGTTVRGRAIVAVHRWTSGTAQPLLVIGSMHGDERAGMRVVRRLRTRSLPTGVNLWLVRTMNPDATAADRRDNARGVDLNRNFPTYFLRSGRGTSTWSGPTPASEPETRAMMSLLRRVQPWTVLSFHQPLLAVDSYREKSPGLVRRLSRLTGLPIAPLDCRDGCHGTMTDWYNTSFPGRAVTVEFGRSAPLSSVARVTTALLAVATSP